MTWKIPPELYDPEIAFKCLHLKFPRNIKRDTREYAYENIWCRECSNMSAGKRRRQAQEASEDS